MRSERNVNITVRDNRGIATLAGFVIVIIFTRLWWTGLLAEMFSAAYSPQGDGMTSATYMVVAFVANLIYGIGTVAVLLWSGVWWLILDVINAFRQYAAERAAVKQVARNETNAEVVDASGENPLVEILQTIESNMEEIAAKIEEIDARVATVESVPKTTRARTTAKAKA
jgi:hypothetical protein